MLILKKLIATSFAIAIPILLFILSSPTVGTFEEATAVKGLVSLRNRENLNRRVVSLGGAWEYYPGRLLSPKDFSRPDLSVKKQFIQIPEILDISSLLKRTKKKRPARATYRLRILLKDSDQRFGLCFAHVNPSAKLFINGRSVTEYGLSEEGINLSTLNGRKSYRDFHIRGSQLELILQIPDLQLSKKGISSIVQFGGDHQLRVIRERITALDIFAVGCFTLLFIYHLFLYSIRRFEKSSLFFSLFCLLSATYMLFRGDGGAMMFPGIGHQIETALFHLPLFFLVPLQFVLLNTLHPTIIKIRHTAPLLLLSSVFFCAVILDFQRVDSILGQCFLGLLSLSAFYLLHLPLTPAAGNLLKRGVLFFSLTLFAFFTTSELLFVTEILDLTRLMPTGLFLTLLSQALLLSHRYSRNLVRAQHLALELAEQQKELDREKQERVEAEKSLWMVSRMVEVANEAKAEFLANISHELRTPMHGILAYSQKGVKKIDHLSKEKIAHYFQQIKSSGERLMKLLNDLLDLTGLESGRAEYHLQPQNISKVIALIIAEYKKEFDNKRLSIEIREDVKSDVATFDRVKITQVIGNLISNAVKYTMTGGNITVALNEDRIEEERISIPAIKISIKDQGIGIPDDELDHVFDKFSQSSKTKTGAGGTGLGLSICREIIVSHGGKIWAENNPDNSGTTFSFTLPH